jgi:hypothetical protein
MDSVKNVSLSLRNVHFNTSNPTDKLCIRIIRTSSRVVMQFPFLGATAKLRKATISFVMSVRPFVRMEQLGSHWTDFGNI